MVEREVVTTPTTTLRHELIALCYKFGERVQYAQHASAHGVGSSLSMPLPFQGVTIGALNNYATAPGAFGEADIAVGQEVTACVALAVGNAGMVAQIADDGRDAGGDDVSVRHD